MWTLVDDQVGQPNCPRILLLPGREAITALPSGTPNPAYTNLATATATGPVASPSRRHRSLALLRSRARRSTSRSSRTESTPTSPGTRDPCRDPVTWTYEVSNTSNVVLQNVAVTDDQLGAITCSATTLAAGASMTCTVSGTAELGQYSNVGTVTGVDPLGSTLRDTTRPTTSGCNRESTSKSSTNGDDADLAPGPLIDIGAPVEWIYTITNNGNEVLEDVARVDDQVGEIDCPQDTLGVAEVMICTATGTAQIGQYANLATVTAVGGEVEPGPAQEVTDSDPSHYFGVVSDIDIIEFVNGQDANQPPGVQLPVGEPIIVTSDVTNPGNIPVATSKSQTTRAARSPTPAATPTATTNSIPARPGSTRTTSARSSGHLRQSRHRHRTRRPRGTPHRHRPGLHLRPTSPNNDHHDHHDHYSTACDNDGPARPDHHDQARHAASYRRQPSHTSRDSPYSSRSSASPCFESADFTADLGPEQRGIHPHGVARGPRCRGVVLRHS